MKLRYFQIVKMVHFDRKNCKSQAKNVGYKTEFCANCTLGLLNSARKSFALSVPPVYIWFICRPNSVRFKNFHFWIILYDAYWKQRKRRNKWREYDKCSKKFSWKQSCQQFFQYGRKTWCWKESNLIQYLKPLVKRHLSFPLRIWKFQFSHKIIFKCE